MFFSEVISSDVLDRVTRTIEFSEEMFPVQIPPFKVPTPSNLRFRREGKFLKKLLNDIVAKRKADPTSKSDYLSHFLNTVDPELQRKWNDKELGDEMFIIMGTSAVAVALGWACYLLAQHPSVMRKLERELTDVFKAGNPSIESLDAVPYLDWVIKEVMRLYPPFWGSVRYSSSEVNIDEYHFPAGSTFLPMRFFSQRSAEYWEHPLAFDPDRFANMDAQRTRKNNPANLLPFGAGPRTCIGVHLAPFICKYVIAVMIQRYSLEYTGRDPNALPRSRFGFGVYPEGKVLLTVHPKSSMQQQ
jgi:cytochrome P450